MLSIVDVHRIPPGVANSAHLSSSRRSSSTVPNCVHSYTAAVSVCSVLCAMQIVARPEKKLSVG